MIAPAAERSMRTSIVAALRTLLLFPSLNEAAYLKMVFPSSFRSPAYSILHDMYFFLHRFDLSTKRSKSPVESGRAMPSNSLASSTLPVSLRLALTWPMQVPKPFSLSNSFIPASIIWTLVSNFLIEMNFLPAKIHYFSLFSHKF